MNKKRLVSLILALSMGAVSLIFAGCADNTDPGENPGGDEVYAKLPESFNGELRDFEGFKFNVLTRKDTDLAANGGYNCIDLVSEDNLGDDTIKQAVYERNERLKAVFDLEIVRYQHSKPYTEIEMSDIIMKQDTTYHAFQGVMSETLATAMEGSLIDFNDKASYVDINEGYWDTNAITALSLKGGAYLLTGDILVGDDERSWCVLFNKELYKEETENEPAVLYEKVLEGVDATGGWTLEYMKSIASTAYRNDPNGNKYAADYTGLGTYGVICQDENALHILQASGYTPLLVGSDGSYFDNTGSEDFINAFYALYDFFGGSDKGAWKFDISQITDIELPNRWTESRNNFKKGRSVFYFSSLISVAQMRDMETEFGILPLPKALDKQLNYGNTVQYYNATCYSAPSWDFYEAGNDERTSYILEAMAYYSSPDYFEDMGTKDKSLKTAYHETLLERKLTRDDESMEMVKIIGENRVYDMSIALSNEDGDIANIIRLEAASVKSPELTSKLGALPDSLDKIIEDKLQNLNKDKEEE